MINNKNIYFLFFLLLLQLISCKSSTESNETIFELLSADKTRIDFENNLSYSDEFNIYKYRNFYNGGGVGLGDINND